MTGTNYRYRCAQSTDWVTHTMVLAHGVIPSMGFNSYGRLVFVGNMVQNATLTAIILADGDPQACTTTPVHASIVHLHLPFLRCLL
jgi:hypothetical protein